MKPTLRDIAEATGLSITSVSLVLNHRPNKLSEQSRRNIFKAAEKLGYHPMRREKRIALPRRLLGLIVPSMTNSFFVDIAHGVEACARENGWQTILATSEDDPERDRQNINSFADNGVSGMVIVTAASYDSKALAPPFHLVQVDRQSPRLNYSAVILDHKKGGYLATKHLLELGHTKIACVTGSQKHQSARQRLDGFFWAYEDAGIPVSNSQIFERDYSSASGYEVADAILEGGFTAAFLGNDMMVLGLFKRLRELGKKVPQDLSVVGFDDIYCASLLDVPLTTIHQSGYDLGYAACERLFIELENPEISKQVIYFQPTLVIRDSTAHI